jgi:hypothetical protein
VAFLQRIFVAVTGQQSDAAIVLTTIVVVSVFTPIRARLQAIVDRRFKETRDPRRILGDYVSALETRLGPIDPDLALRRLLQVAITAFDAADGSITIGEAGHERVAAATGRVPPEPALDVASGSGSAGIRLRIGPRVGGSPYRDQDRTVAESAVAAVAQALVEQAALADLVAGRVPRTER